MRLSDIKLDTEIYPRGGQDNIAVAAYRLAIDHLPPILVTHENWLVDGYHRYLAHVAEGRHEIEAEIIELSKEHILFEATKRNAKHGKQLTRKEKESLARKFFGNVPDDDIVEALAVSKRTYDGWVSEQRKTAKEERDECIWQAWLACKSTPEIAEAEGIEHPTVLSVVEKCKSAKIYSEPPLSLQLFDVWHFGQCDERYGQANFPGRIPGQMVENLLWCYTEPGDIVLDPMAGGGTAIDVCKAMGRRYLAYDLLPVRADVAKHDARDPFPLPDSITKAHLSVKLVFIDPPYWKQKQDKYEPGGLADLDLQAFYAALLQVLANATQVLDSDGYVAILLGHTQENKEITDHAADLLRLVDLSLVRRVIVPYNTQQHSGAYVEWAQNNRCFLCLYRDLMIWKK